MWVAPSGSDLDESRWESETLPSLCWQVHLFSYYHCYMPSQKCTISKLLEQTGGQWLSKNLPGPSTRLGLLRHPPLWTKQLPDSWPLQYETAIVGTTQAKSTKPIQ